MHRLVILCAGALIVAAPAQSNAVKWMDGTAAGLPAGAKFVVLKGDPSKAEDFVIRAKFPANYTVPPHNHPTDETVRVLSAGELTYGMGDKVDQANSGKLTKGYHVTMKAGMNHWVTSSEPLTIEVTGMGPFAITYVNPADDPRKK